MAGILGLRCHRYVHPAAQQPEDAGEKGGTSAINYCVHAACTKKLKIDVWFLVSFRGFVEAFGWGGEGGGGKNISPPPPPPLSLLFHRGENLGLSDQDIFDVIDMATTVLPYYYPIVADSNIDVVSSS